MEVSLPVNGTIEQGSPQQNNVKPYYVTSKDDGNISDFIFVI